MWLRPVCPVMSFVAELTVPPETLPFGRTLADHPNIRIEVERIVPTDETALPFYWVWGRDFEAFVGEAEQEPEISETQVLDTVEGGALVRVAWSASASVVDGLRRLGGTILEAEGTAEHWRFEIRAESRDPLVEFRELVEAEGISLTLNRLYDLSELVEDERHALTDEQRETLVRAYREGYYENPREVTQAELGETFDVSHRAVSERVRRGTRNLIAGTLLPDPEG